MLEKCCPCIGRNFKLTGIYAFSSLVVHNWVLIASKLVKCYMVRLWHSGAPYAFAVLRPFFFKKKLFFIDCNSVVCTWTVECLYHHSSHFELPVLPTARLRLHINMDQDVHFFPLIEATLQFLQPSPHMWELLLDTIPNLLFLVSKFLSVYVHPTFLGNYWSLNIWQFVTQRAPWSPLNETFLPFLLVSYSSHSLTYCAIALYTSLRHASLLYIHSDIF